MITHQNAKEWLPVVQAMAEGKQIQICTETGEWKTITNLSDCNFQLGDYRIAPEKKRVPLNAEDIPPVCWVRWPSGAHYLVTSISCDAVCAAEEWSTFVTLKENEVEYSADRKNWKPCWKEVAE